MKIAIVDYGMGNICSLSSTLNYIGINDIVITDNYNDLKCADKLILPGVGSFAKAIKTIRSKNLNIYLDDIVLENKKPLLGICLGMQLLANSSNEEGENLGLGYVNANVTKFLVENLKIPHVGFNQIEICKTSILYKSIPNNPDFYFTHSFKMTSQESINQSFCNYGENFIASFEYNNIYGTQFHPELSQTNGIQLLKNFINI